MIERDPKQDAKQVNSFASRALMRVRAAGDHITSLEDLKQELWVAWCLAVENFDAKAGVPFGAYLQRGMRQHINRHIEKHVSRRHDEVTALSLDYTVRDDDEEVAFADAVPSADPSPDVEIEWRSQLEYAMSLMSPRAKLFVSLLERQPPELLEEVRRLQARSDYARERGLPTLSFNRLTAAMVFDLIGASASERVKINHEIRHLSDLLGQDNK